MSKVPDANLLESSCPPFNWHEEEILIECELFCPHQWCLIISKMKRLLMRNCTIGQRIALTSPYSWINQYYLPRTTTRTNCKKLRQLGKLHLLAPLVWIILIIWGGLPLKSVQMEGLLIRNCTQTTTPSKLSKLLLIVAGIIIEERAGASLLMRTCTKGHDPDYWLSKLPKAPAITNVTAHLLSSQGLSSNLKISL